MPLSQEQLAALSEIERQVALIRSLDVPNEEIIFVNGDLQQAINNAPEGAILDLLSLEHNRAIVIEKPLTIRNGMITAPPNTNDLINITGDHVKLTNLSVRGDGTTKRGILAHGMFMEFDNVQVRNIRRAGQETQAIAMWNSPGPLTVRNSILEAGSIGFLAGGARPNIENTIPTGLLFENVLFTRPAEWRGQGFACKNAFELKCAQDVVLRNCTLENVWTEGQTGSAIVLTPVNYGNSPEATVQNVVFDTCIIRNCGNGVNLLGFGQQANPTRKSNDLHWRNCRFSISKLTYGGQGALVQIGAEPENVEFNGCDVTQDGDAFIRVSDSRPITDFRFINSTVNRTGTYGIFTPIGSRGIGFSTIFPGGLVENNTFYAAHSIFKTNFPTNTYIG